MHGEQVRYAHKEERKKKNEEWWAGHPHPIITPLCHFATKGGCLLSYEFSVVSVSSLYSIISSTLHCKILQKSSIFIVLMPFPFRILSIVALLI